MKSLIALLLISFTLPTFAKPHPVIDTLDWVLKKSSKGVDVYTAKLADSKYKAVLSVTTIDAKPEEVVALIRNTESCEHWVFRCKGSHVHQAISDKEEYIYTSLRMPFPLNSRDILAHITWEKDPASGTTTSTGVATQDILEEKQGHTRIKNAKMIWEIKALDNGQTQIRNYGHVNPAGGVPIWLTNRFALKAPLKTMQGLRKLLKEES